MVNKKKETKEKKRILKKEVKKKIYVKKEVMIFRLKCQNY